ncbi:MAG TPA: PLP-dependent aminotransferase family protein [Steroidobacteraceae bacterium]|nr:PLP-dependent aminotransferase family protein [Steroidobacteraceae bacterium]
MPQANVPPLWSSLALERDRGVSLQDQIVRFFRAAITDGRMRGGQRVASSRQLALDCGVSRTTAVEAYDRLVEEGYFVTRAGAGVFVADVPPQQFAPPATIAASSDTTARNAVARLDARSYQLPLAPGMPAIDRFPWSTWARLTNQICRERPLNAIGYGDPQGELELRQAIAEYLAAARGIRCSASQVVVLAGSLESLEFMVGRVALAGDAAWIEEPAGPWVRSILAGAGVMPVPVEVDHEGLIVPEALRRAPRARLAIVSPTHQYPTGATLSLARRELLVDWCESTGAWILENEVDGDYRYMPQPIAPIYTLSRARRVFYCGSVSKPFAPGLRTNYLVMPESLMDNLALRPTLVPMLTQLVLARFNAAGHMGQHMRRMRTLYVKRRTALLDALQAQVAEFLEVPRIPEGGLRVTATLKHSTDDLRIADRCLAAGIKVDPLSVCHVGPPRAGLIIGFASTPEERIPAAVATLAKVLRRELDL